jgi:SAM-dependent methyltransferase
MEKVCKCYNCEGSNIVNYTKVPDRHYGIKGEYTMSKCENCGLVFMDPMPNSSELSSFYPEESYYSYHIDIYKEASLFKRILKSIFFLQIKVTDVNFNKIGNVLDLGCGNGWKLFQYKKKGWGVYGVEPSKVGSEIGNKADLNIFNGDLFGANFDSDFFDYIRSNHSFEHIHNPNEILNELNRIMKYDGKIMIGIPNINGLVSKIFGDYWYYLGAPVHTVNYNPKTITEILNKNGFKVTSINYCSNWAGILGSIQIYLNRKSIKNSEQGFIFNFVPFRILAGFVASILNLFKMGDCIEVIAVKSNVI